MQRLRIFQIFIIVLALFVAGMVYAGKPLWTFAPVPGFPPKVLISNTGSVTVKYQVTNQSKRRHTLAIKPQAGITQAQPCVLRGKGSCILTLIISGKNLPPSGVFGGPALCQVNRYGAPNPNQCYRPSQAYELNIKVIQVPGAPTNVIASAGNASALVNWTAPANDGGSAITGYTVTSKPGGLQCTTTGAKTCTVNGLTNGTSYTFTVTATNVVGTGPASSPSNAVTPATVPGAPTNVIATRENAAALVNWTAPAENGGSDITAYTVTSTPGSLQCTTTGATSCTVNGLINGTLYRFTVTATNKAGTGPASNPSNPVIPATVPGAPTNVVAVGGNTAALINWTAPVDNGGAIITRYTVTSSPGGLQCTTPRRFTTCRIAGLTNGTTYTFTVTATNLVGTGPDSSASNPVTPATTPGAPTNVIATPGDTSALVNWTPPISNGGSEITAYTVTSAPGNLQCTTNGTTSCTVNGLTNGTSYTFTVTATNAKGTGPASSVSNPVTPGTVPGAPTGVIAAAGNASASISWTSPTSDGGSVITGYTVTSTPGSLQCTAVGATSCTVEGLTNGTSYTFTVTATNAIGTGPASSPSNAVTPATLPGAPTNVIATPADTSALVNWTAPASNGGSNITGYTVTSTPGSLQCTTTGATSCTVSGLTNGTSYTFTVTATNGVGTGPASSASNPVTPATVPGAPTGVVALGGNTAALVNWTAPADNGGSIITGYTVTSAPGGFQCTTRRLTACRVAGLTNGTTYTFTVTATNGVGTSSASTPSNAVTPATVPGAPTNVIATAQDAAALVNWTAPANDGGSAITGYTVTSAPDGLQCTTAGATSCTVNGLTNGISYTFTVTATNARGTGPASSLSNPVTPATVPGAPTGVNATADNASASVNWLVPSSDGGSVITGYTVTSTPGSLQCTTEGATSCTVDGLTNGTSYTFTVTATNAVGTGPASSPSNAVIPATVPGAPTNLVASAGNTSALLNWTAPIDNGGSVITGYTVTSTPGGLQCTTTGATSCTVNGLTNGTIYTFTVTATNVAGTGPASSVSNPVKPASVPGAPTSVVALGGNTAALINWTAPADNGGSIITGYTVTSAPGGFQCTTRRLTACRITGLTNGTTYTFTVTATNGVGTGPASIPSNAVTPASAPDAPTNVIATGQNAAALVNWTAPADDGGSAITGYTVTSSPGGFQCTTTGATSCTVDQLTNGTSYTFTVTATNARGTSPASSISNPVTPATVPGAPTSVSAVGGNASASISWIPPTDNGGSAITGYTVTSAPDGLQCTTTGATSCSINGLNNGISYTFTVTATNAIGTGLASNPSNAVVPTAPTVPGAPTSAIAAAGNTSAQVSWTAPADDGGSTITGYTVTSAPGAFQCTTTGATTCTVNGLTNGVAYTFTVTATNGVGTGPASTASNAVTPTTVPGAPTSVIATGGNASAQVNWTAPVDDGGSAISGYTVTSSPGNLQCTATGATTCTVNNLTNGTSYTFTVTATNATGTGTASNPSNAVTPATVPGAPTGAIASAGNASALIAWTAPASNGGSAITGYTVTSTPGSFQCTTTGATTCTVNGLNNGTTYTFTITATNAVGTGPASAASNSVTPTTLPGAPTSVTATPGNTSALVGWTAPASDGGSTITGYTVTSTPSNFQCTTTGATSCTVNGLTNGVTYTFTVTATNAVGTGPVSSPSNPVTPATVPGVPTDAFATAGNASALVSWTAPSSDGGSDISEYTVTSSPGGEACTSTGALSCTVNNLTNGTSYTFTVTATNDVGTGAPSNASNAVIPVTVPGAPTNVNATAGNSFASITWNAPTSNGGSTITGYTVSSTPGGFQCTTTGALTCNVNGLSNGTSYTFKVTATNAVGTGAASSASNAVIPATVPGAPTGVVASGGNASALVNWTAPSNNGGSPITEYTVTSAPGGFQCTAIGATSSGCTVNNLTNGTTYTFTVTATNAVGTGAASNASNAVTPATVPGAPTNVNATAGNTLASVTWEIPASNGGSTITGYTVTSAPGGLQCTATGATSSGCTVNNLTNGTSYTFTVTATNAVGTSPASSASNPVIPATIPGAPTGVIATPQNASAVLSWSAPASDGGSAISEYTVTSIPAGGTCTTTGALSCTVDNLTNGVSYTFTVTATNAVGTGLPSSPSNAAIPATIPGAPTSVSATAGNALATVNWTAPTDNGGSDITQYTVTSSPGGGTCITTGATSCTVNGLTNGTSYTFSVTATNVVGTGPASSDSDPVTPATVPGAPTNVVAKRGNASALVSWIAPADDGGSEIINYTVTSTPGGLQCTTTGATSCTVNNLINGTAYTFTVTATNGSGTGPASAPSNSVTPATLPGAPTNVLALSENSSAPVSWDAPASDGGSPITGYTVTSSPGGHTCTTTGTTLCTVNGLTNGTAYTFTVTATNAVGTGPASSPSDPVIPATVPGAPTNAVASITTGNNFASISWTAPASDGGADITEYRVTASPGGNTCTTTGASTSCAVNNLTYGTTYTFTVTATNEKGTGAASSPSNAVTPVTIPGAPTGVVATAEDASAAVTWTAPASDGGSAITSYKVTSSPGGNTCTTTGATSCTVALTNNTTYTFTVTATNAVGTGPASAPSNAVTPRASTTIAVAGSPLLLTPNTTGYLTVSNTGSEIAYDVQATLPSDLDVTQDASDCDTVAVGATCYLQFTSSTQVHSATTVTIAGTNTPTPVSAILTVAVPYATNGLVYATALDEANNILYLGGEFTQVGPSSGFGAPIDIYGGLRDMIYPAVNGPVYSVVSDGVDGWYIGGDFSQIGGVPRNNLAHILYDGSLDLNWEPNVNAAVNILKLHGDTLYVGGSFTTIDGLDRPHIAALNAYSGLPSSWSLNVDGDVRALAINENKIYLGGSFTRIDEQPRKYIAAVDITSGVVSTWNPHADKPINNLIFRDNKVYVGGEFTTIGGQSRNHIAAIDENSGLPTLWDPNVNKAVKSLILKDNTLYIGGDFTAIGQQIRNHIAAIDIDSGHATSWNPNADKAVKSLLVNDNMVYAGGDFTAIGGEKRNHIAALDVSTGVANSWKLSANQSVETLAMNGNVVYVGGKFNSLAAETRNHAAAINTATGVVTSWNPNLNGTVRAIFYDTTPGQLTPVYLGGDFTISGSPNTNYITRVNTTTGEIDHFWHPNPDNHVYSVVRGPNAVYLGGIFSKITLNNATRIGIAAVDVGGNGGAQQNWNANLIGGQVYTIVLGNQLYFGGFYYTTSLLDPKYISAADLSTGKVSTTWDPKANDLVNTLLLNGSTIYVGGAFTSIGGAGRNYIASLNISDSKATGWDPNADDAVNALAISGSTIYAAGDFETINEQDRIGVAAIDSTGVPTSWIANLIPFGVGYALAVSDSTVYIGGSFNAISSSQSTSSLQSPNFAIVPMAPQ